MPEIQIVISGIGQSAIGRKLDRSGLALTLDAALEAIEDAGLDRSEIDGLSSYPGKMTGAMGGFSPVGTHEVINALRLEVGWYNAGPEGAAQQQALINAYAAIKAGLARHVLVFRTIAEGSGTLYWRDTALPQTRQRTDDPRFEYLFPFNAVHATNWVGLAMRAHFHRYGTTREQVGAIAVNNRRNAGLNPNAIFREPITLQNYLDSKMISDPLCLLDCDAPTDGSIAFVLSDAAAARDMRSYPIRIDSVAGALTSVASWDQSDLPFMALHDAAKQLWTRTSLRPADVDVGCIYDGFSFLCLNWIEALGFCKIGEGGAFVEGGERIALAGELPLNPHGGQLSAGRMHGFGFIHEAVVQLRRQGGDRQVPGNPEVALACAGGGPQGGAMLLTR